MRYIKQKNSEKSFASVVSILVLATLLFLGVYFLSFMLTESRISKSQAASIQTYYLSEAGVNELIWRIKNDVAWKNNFETVLDWSDSFTRTDILLPGSSYTISIQNTTKANGLISAQSSVVMPGGNDSKRVVEAGIFKALNDSPIEDSALFTGGVGDNTQIKWSVLNINDGNLFSGHQLLIKNNSDVTINDDPATPAPDIEGQALAASGINTQSGGTLTATARCSNNYCDAGCDVCPPDSILMPMIDFNSSDSNSYKSMAQADEDASLCESLCNGAACSCSGNPCAGNNKCVLTGEEFHDLLWAAGSGGTLTLNSDITYVMDSVNLRGGRKLVVNGILAAQDDIDIGQNICWNWNCNFLLNKLTVNKPDDDPSGIIAGDDISIGSYMSLTDISITGIVYASDFLNIQSVPWNFEVEGGLVSRKFYLTSCWFGLDITLDKDIVSQGIGSPSYSPVVMIDHWEEVY